MTIGTQSLLPLVFLNQEPFPIFHQSELQRIQYLLYVVSGMCDMLTKTQNVIPQICKCVKLKSILL